MGTTRDAYVTEWEPPKTHMRMCILQAHQRDKRTPEGGLLTAAAWLGRYLPVFCGGYRQDAGDMPAGGPCGGGAAAAGAGVPVVCTGGDPGALGGPGASSKPLVTPALGPPSAGPCMGPKHSTVAERVACTINAEAGPSRGPHPIQEGCLACKITANRRSCIKVSECCPALQSLA
jgi:hypothetical protein